MDKKEYMKVYRKTHKADFKNWLTKTYGRMKRDNKHKFNAELPFSKQQFADWVLCQNIFELLDDYKNNNFDKDFNPSINRIDDYKGYSFENIELITWKENNEKGRKSLKNKEQCAKMSKEKWSKKVIQKDLEGNIINIFNSTHDVNRILGFNSSLIARACRLNKISKGYRWEYEQKM